MTRAGQAIGPDGLTCRDRDIIREVLARYPEVRRVTLFGSRAMDTFGRGSDIDLALEGPDLTTRTLARIAADLEDSDLPYKVDLLLRDRRLDPKVEEHIRRHGKPFGWEETNPRSISEQRVIAAVLGALDDKIEHNRRTARALERLARAIFRTWFVDFEPVKAKAAGATAFPSMLQPVFDAVPTRLVDSEIGRVPEGWEVKPVSAAFDVNPPRALRKGAIAPYLDMKNMPTEGHAPETWIDREAGSGMKFINGDTLVARITPCLENGKTAFVDFLRDGQVGWGSTEYIVLRPKPPLPDLFGYCLARTAEFRDYAIQNMSGTSGRQRVVSAAMDHLRIATPPEDTATAFGQIVQPMFACVRAGMNESRKLAELRDYLLPKLLSGAAWVGGTEDVR